ncbi:MAG TPA: glycosyltransferase family 4 protein [Solirubrobacteraceae bacterium]|nr:glycosyltransferase family 4 protein [Solirubrobacteraceae bacterium]
MRGSRSSRHALPRLLILTADFPPAHGGVQSLVYGLARSLRRFDVEVVTLDALGARCFDRDEKLTTHRVGGPRIGSRPAPLVSAGRARMLALNAAGLTRASRSRPDVTLSAHLVTSPAATLIRRLLGTPIAQYFYGNEIAGKPRLAAFAAARADLVIAISDYTASLLAATGAPTTALEVIPPGVELPGDPSPLPAQRPTVVTIAQLKHRYKGHDVLIRALPAVRARVPDVEWVVIGEGPLRSELERLASASGLDGVARFLGAVSDEERDAWLRRAAVLALPSRLPAGELAGEGFGIVYLEANSFAKPVVAGDVGGAREAVADGVSGLLVDPTDPAAVTDAVTRLLLDRDLARRLGAGGARRARAFAWPAIGARVERRLLALAGRSS